jgi:hypothetical protein
MNSTKHSRKTVTQSITMSQNNKEHRIHNRKIIDISQTPILGTFQSIMLDAQLFLQPQLLLYKEYSPSLLQK